MDQYHEDPYVLKQHPEEITYNLVNHLVKMSEMSTRVKSIKLKNE